MKSNKSIFIILLMVLSVSFIGLTEEQVITPQELEGKTLAHIYMMRNEIFAQRGRPFKTYELNNYFRSQDWYQIGVNEDGTVTYSDNRLTEIDRKNIEALLEKEKELLQQNFIEIDGKKKINTDNIINLWQFGELASEDLERLSQFGFTIFPCRYPNPEGEGMEWAPAPYEQFFWLYENNNYYGVANFITTDAILQLYHIFFDFTLRNLESEKLFPVVKELTNQMLELSKSLFEKAENKDVQHAALRNIAYFAVPQFFLTESERSYPHDIQTIIQSEIDKSTGAVGRENSEIFNPDFNPDIKHDMDYSQFIIRGHYTRSEELKRYFMALMWYGQNYFLADQQTDLLQSLIITKQLFDNSYNHLKLIELWETIYEPTVFYVGLSDDLGPQEYKIILDTVYGKNINFEDLSDPIKLAEAQKIAEEMYSKKKRIKTELYLIPSTAQFRFMGQRYIPDSEILQRLTKWTDTVPRIPLRPFPKGLDVMAVLGSRLATKIALEEHQIEGNIWKEYPENLEKLTVEFSQLTSNDWKTNLYYNWLFCLKSLLQLKSGYDYPFYMRNQAWEKKNLITSLASWSQLRHDVILYGSPSGAEKGGWEEWIPDPPKCQVEANPEFFGRMLELLIHSRDGLQQRDLLTKPMQEKFEKFIDLVEFLYQISLKEVTNQPVTNEEHEKLYTFGALLENLTISVMTDDESISNWFEIQSDTDKNVAVIADIHTAQIEVEENGQKIEKNLALEVGVGPVYEIYVVTEVDGYLKLTRGATFSYFEFLHPADDRLTDEKWQAMLKAGSNPPPPIWTQGFFSSKYPPEIPRLDYIYYFD
jgi:hypothetical protein